MHSTSSKANKWGAKEARDKDYFFDKEMAGLNNHPRLVCWVCDCNIEFLYTVKRIHMDLSGVDYRSS